MSRSSPPLDCCRLTFSAGGRRSLKKWPFLQLLSFSRFALPSQHPLLLPDDNEQQRRDTTRLDHEELAGSNAALEEQHNSSGRSRG
ncbi:hypothetical protein VTN00DRAFT_2330 [Thermoascus crustaceus]|uniref:uncharacterized protein n=1 Tax=Thermoascus crustaceus TaxID=5088 RepID=UPI003743B5CC